MRTRGSFWTFVAATALLVGGLVLRELRLLALLLPLLALLAIAALFAPPRPRCEVDRTLEAEALREGDAMWVTLRVRNPGPPLSFLEVYDAVPRRGEVTEGSNRLLLELGTGEAKTLRYRVRFAVKGRYSLGPVVLRSRDPLGLYVREWRGETTDTVLVSPTLEDVREVAVFPRRTIPRFGQVAARTAGPGTEFWAIRGYQAGDELRRVNWKATARHDALLVNEREAERSGDVVLILDARDEALVGSPVFNTVEMGVRAVFSLAARLIQDRNRVGLVIQRDVLDWVYPAFGRKQLYRILDALVQVRPGGRWPFRQIAWILRRFFPPRSLLIVVSPMGDRVARDTILDLRARDFDVLLVSPSSLEVERRLAQEDGTTELAYRVLQMRRKAHLGYLRRYVPVVDWDPTQPLALAMKEVTAWQRRR